MCYYYSGEYGMKNDINVQSENSSVFKKIFFVVLIVLFIIVLFFVYARYKSTSGLVIREYKVTNSSLPDSFHGAKVVHLSDIHFGNTTSIDDLKYIVKKVNELEPDIVVFTGDLGNVNSMKQEVITVLSSIDYSIGKYGIKGEDDNDLFDDVMSNSGFINLTDSYLYIYFNDDEPIFIGNVSSEFDGFSLLLLHEPDNISNYSNFSLALAGHSHNGQINLPFIKSLFLPNGSKKYYDSYYDIDGASLYVSSGIGTSHFKLRFNNKPSVNLYRLTKY